ncbi:deaminase [Bacteroides uniformis]|uniref:deaminase n=1 Tax=Bacteroides uniformis TaxID=820 RepID=UPI0032C04ACB
MGKVQILAVLTMDGCLSSELYDKAHQDLCLDRCGLDEIRKKAFYRVTPDYSISMLDEWRKDNTNICYLAEATPDNSDYINGLLRMRVVDEIILYTVPFISGTGRHFFKSALPEARWTLSSQKSYSNGVYRSIYTRMETMK